MGSVIAARIDLQRQLGEMLTKSLAGPAEPYRVEVTVRLDLRGRIREVREKLESLSPAVKIGGKNKVKLPGLGTVDGGGQGGLLPEITLDGGGRVVEQVSRHLETEVAQMTILLFVDPVMPKDRRELLVRLAGEMAGIDRARGDDVVVEERPSGPAAPIGGGGLPTVVQATLQTSSKITPEVIALCLTALLAAGILAWGLSRRSTSERSLGLSGAGGGAHGGADERGALAGAAAAAADVERKKRREDVGAFKVLADATPAEIVQVIAEADPHTATAIVDLFGVDAEASKGLDDALSPQRRLEIGMALASPRVLTREQLGQMEAIAEQVLQRVRNRVPLGGPARLAEFLSAASSNVRHEVLQAIAARDEDVARAARSAMLLFEDLPRLADGTVRQIVAGVDPATMALAMVGAPDVREAILAAVSKRLRSILEVEEEVVKDKPPAEVETARRAVEDAMRAVQGRGELRARAA
jgi:flagellar motor switch protein FliG